jgi:hypothetical protein
MATVIVDFEANADDLLGALQGIDTAADRTSRTLDTVSTTSQRTTENIDGMKFAAQAAGGRIGEMAGRVENAGRAISSFAANPVALATAGVVALGASAAIAGAAVVASFVGIQRAAEDAAERIADLDTLGIDDEDIAAINTAGAALDAIGVVVDELIVSLGAEFAPLVTQVSTLIVAAGLAGVDAFNSLAQSVDLGREIIVRLIEFAVNPLHASIATLLDGVAAMADFFGDPAAEKIGRMAEAMREAQTANTLFDGSIDLVESSMGDYIGKAEALIGDLALLRQETEQAAEATDTLADAQRQAAEANKALADQARRDREAQLAQIEHIMEANKAAFDAAISGALEATTGLTKYEEAAIRVSSAMGGVAAVTGTVSELASALGDAFLTFGADAEKAARMAFAANKAAGIADAVVKTAQSIMAALTIPPPVGPVLAGVNAATGALQIATIAATTFEGGGPTPRAPGAGAGGAGGGDAAPAPMVKPASTERGPAFRGGAAYRHRDLDIVAADGGYPGSAFDLAPARRGQRRYRD